MSTPRAPLDDWINGVFRPVIGFFAGLGLGYTAQLGQMAGWSLATVSLALAAVAFGVILATTWFDFGIDWVLRKIGLGDGIKPAREVATPQRAHWIVRFGWIIGLILGLVAAFILPPEVISWF